MATNAERGLGVTLEPGSLGFPTLEQISQLAHRLPDGQLALPSFSALPAPVVVSPEILFLLRHVQPPFNDEVSASIGTFLDLRYSAASRSMRSQHPFI